MNHSIKSKNAIRLPLPDTIKKPLAWVALGWVAAAACEAGAYIVLAYAISYSLAPYWVLLSALVAISITIIVTRAGYLTGVRLAGSLFSELGQSLSSAKLSWFNQEQRVKIAQMAGQTIPEFMSIPAHQFQTFVHAPCLPIFILIGVGYVAGWTMMLLGLCLIAIAFYIQFKAQKRLMKSDEQRQQIELESKAATLELIDHLELLQTARGPVFALERIEQRWSSQEQLFDRINLSAAWATALGIIASILPMLGIVLYWLFTRQENIALLLALLILFGRATAPLAELATAGLRLNNILNALKSFYQVTHAPVLSEPKLPEQPSQYTIQLEQISYTPILNNIQVSIPDGARVHVAGRSGSGKSTLLELLMRFDDPSAGQITLGGIDLKHIRYAELIQHMAYVSQDAIIFTGTLADNIRLGRINASDDEIESIARRCELSQVIERSSDGIHQFVGQQGAALSGGERQRLAIARALVKKAPILILDEATSALDEVTEQAVIKTILAMSQTIIFVSHRDTSAWQATQTIYLKPVES